MTIVRVKNHGGLSVMIDEHFIQPKTVSEALTRAKKVISNEKRWCAGRLFDTSKIKYDGNYEKIVTCKNVQVCALGALAMVIDNGAIIYDQFAANRNAQTWLMSHKIGSKAVRLLDDASQEVLIKIKKRAGGGVVAGSGDGNTTIHLNDSITDYELEISDKKLEHLQNIIEAFEIAIERANQLGV